MMISLLIAILIHFEPRKSTMVLCGIIFHRRSLLTVWEKTYSKLKCLVLGEGASTSWLPSWRNSWQSVSVDSLLQKWLPLRKPCVDCWLPGAIISFFRVNYFSSLSSNVLLSKYKHNACAATSNFVLYDSLSNNHPIFLCNSCYLRCNVTRKRVVGFRKTLKFVCRKCSWTRNSDNAPVSLANNFQQPKFSQGRTSVKYR